MNEQLASMSANGITVLDPV